MALRDIILGKLDQPQELQKLREYLIDLYGYVSVKPTTGTVRTTDGATTTALTIPLEDNKTSHVLISVSARRTGGSAGTAGDGASYIIAGTFRRVSAGNSTLIGSLTVVHSGESQPAWDATLSVSGTDLLVRVGGAANNSISWSITATVQVA